MLTVIVKLEVVVPPAVTLAIHEWYSSLFFDNYARAIPVLLMFYWGVAVVMENVCDDPVETLPSCQSSTIGQITTTVKYKWSIKYDTINVGEEA